MSGGRRTAPTGPGTRANLGLAAVAAALAVVFALVRSRRTGIEVGLVAVALALFGLRDLAVGPRRVLRVGAWIALVGVVALAVEPHVH